MDEEYNDSFYPFIDYITESVSDIESEEDDTLPLYREIAWDFKNEHPLIINNEFKIVEENEAICVWIWHAIKTFRYYFSIYSWDFGSEIDTLLGQNYTPELTKMEVIRYIEEALLINPYILEINKLEVDFDGDTLQVDMRAITIYEELEVNFVV